MKNTGNETIASIKKLLATNPGNLVVVPHENPDGDAIGAAIGLSEVLRNFGHQVNIIAPNDYPDFFKWFSSGIEVVLYDKEKSRAKRILKNASVLICVDFNEPRRAGRMEKHLTGFSGPSLLIDHHPDPASFTDHIISEIQYSSTAELVYDVLKETGLESYLTMEAAEALFTGIMTDTGSFSHNISRPNLFRVVAALMEWGIAAEKIHSNVFHNFSPQRMKLLGHCLNKKMEIFPEYRAALISISKRELEEFNFKPGDTEGFVNYPLSVNNIVFSALFIEKEEKIKASFRSKGDFPVNEFSRKHFGGGGHRNAAGGEDNGTLEATIDKFRQLLPEYMHQLNKTVI